MQNLDIKKIETLDIEKIVNYLNSEETKKVMDEKYDIRGIINIILVCAVVTKNKKFSVPKKLSKEVPEELSEQISDEIVKYEKLSKELSEELSEQRYNEIYEKVAKKVSKGLSEDVWYKNIKNAFELEILMFNPEYIIMGE